MFKSVVKHNNNNNNNNNNNIPHSEEVPVSSCPENLDESISSSNNEHDEPQSSMDMDFQPTGELQDSMQAQHFTGCIK